MTQDIAYRDRLSSAADKWLFFALWLLGTLGIVAFKAAGSAALGVVWGVSVLLAYAASVWRSPRFRVREDRAGDSAYYLGFLFTLTSLAYSLWEFSRDTSTTSAIIGNFAIALATTIVGLALRVLFQQFREDPIEIEQQVRLEIADRVTALRSQLTHVVEDLSSLSTTVRTELKDQYAESLAHITATAVERVRAAYDTHIECMQGSLKAFQNTSETLQQETAAARGANKKMVEAIDRFTERIARSKVPTESLERALQELTAFVARVLDSERRRVDRDQQAFDSLREAADAAVAAFARVSQAAPALHESTKAAAGEVKAFATALAESKQVALDQGDGL